MYHFQKSSSFTLVNLVNLPYICIVINNTHKKTAMKQYTNTFNLEVGDIITFTNSVNYKVSIPVTRVEEKSWYSNKSRNSYGTLLMYSKYNDFKIVKK